MRLLLWGGQLSRREGDGKYQYLSAAVNSFREV